MYACALLFPVYILSLDNNNIISLNNNINHFSLSIISEGIENVIGIVKIVCETNVLFTMFNLFSLL